MSAFQPNITDTKYKGRRRSRQIDVLVPTDDYDEDDVYSSFTRSYMRGDNELYSEASLILLSRKMATDEEGTAAWDCFETFLNESAPLKIMHWTTALRKGAGDTSMTFLNRRGELVDSFDSLIESMPAEALDATITVQAKSMRDKAPCRLCRDGYNPCMELTGYQAEVEEKMRHNVHVVDGFLTVAPIKDGDEKNLFLGQEDQVTTRDKLREILIDRTYDSDSLKLCVAQETIYSKEESNLSATVNKAGEVVIEDGNKTANKAPLAALLPWIRVPSFLLPTASDKVDIQEINFWMCPEECRTNTHYDGHHNILMVLSGTKTVELSPPGAFRGSPVHSTHANHPLLLRCTDVGGHLINESFAEETISFTSHRNNIVVSVTAGEAIFIPEGWWHRVESSANCVAINVWFDHKGSSISGMAHEKNLHMLPYQAREMVRRCIDANIEDVTKRRLVTAFRELLKRLGLTFETVHDWHPGRAIKGLFDTMNLGRIIPQERTNEEIGKGMDVIEHYASQLLAVSDRRERTDSTVVQPLRHIVLPAAATILGLMISLFITVLDHEKKQDRIAMLSLLERFPAVVTSLQREVFTAVVMSISQVSCYKLSVAWEKHESSAEAEASYNSFFGRCVGDEGRKYFLKEIDDFRNESARRLILGDLMMLNPIPSSNYE